MYETFYGLRERPFELTPNPRFLFVTPRHREALINLEFGIARRKGIVVLVGEPGTGKTTVIRALMAKRREVQTKYVYLNHAIRTPAEFRQFVARSFDLSRPAEGSNTYLIQELTDRLLGYRQKTIAVAFIVDEAQSLPDELLEQIRLLTNVETTEDKLLTLALVGQPKLADRLNDEAWKQLKQRIELRSTLTPFDLHETAAYVWSRIRTAGGDAARLFTLEAVRVVHERSRGIARSISVICDNALMSGFAEHEQPVTRRLVLEVCDELDLHALEPAVDDSPGAASEPDSREGSNPGQGRLPWQPSAHAGETVPHDLPPTAVTQPRRRSSLLSRASSRP